MRCNFAPIVLALSAFGLAAPARADRAPTYKSAPTDTASEAAVPVAVEDDEPTVDAKNQLSEGEYSLDDELEAKGPDATEDDLFSDEEDEDEDVAADADETKALSATPTDAEVTKLALDYAEGSAKTSGAAAAEMTTTEPGAAEPVANDQLLDPEAPLSTPRTSFAATPNPEAHAPNPKNGVVDAARGTESAATARAVTESPKPPKLPKNAVAALQSALAKHGIACDVDGVVGKNTRTALREFQRKNGLDVNGEADLATLEKLGVTY